jgi:lipoprotein NlpI
MRWSLPGVLLGFLLGAICAAEPPTSKSKPSLDEQIAEATRALEADPNGKEALARRAALYAAAGKSELAIGDFDRLLQLDPSRAEAYDARGSEQFKLGHIDESIADFDRFLKLRPDQEPWHWKRGISDYYAGRYDEGRKQFQAYQTVDDNDVENAVWCYLCTAKTKGVDVARREMLDIKRDPRPVMMEVYDLFRGKAAPDAVLEAVEKGSPSPEEQNVRLFYAHLYLGLYFESLGQRAKAKEHIVAAAEKHKLANHYMWNVAEVHAARLKTAYRDK